jgi:hypothetical protein
MALGRFCFLVMMLLSVLVITPTTGRAQSSDVPTTGTLQFSSAAAGVFSVGPALTIRAQMLRPDVNRALAFTASSPAANRFNLKADRGEIRIAQVAPAQVVAEATVREGTNALLILEVTTTDKSTTPTINWERNSITISDGVGPVTIQVEGAKLLRSNIPNGIRLVAPVRPKSPVRFAVVREEMPEADLLKFQLSSARPQPLSDRISVLASARMDSGTSRQSQSSTAPMSARAAF